jgi:hypothetical protein
MPQAQLRHPPGLTPGIEPRPQDDKALQRRRGQRRKGEKAKRGRMQNLMIFAVAFPGFLHHDENGLLK